MFLVETTRSATRPAPPVVVGVDVGQRVDPTAIAVTEMTSRKHAGAWCEYEFTVRHMERLPLGTAYPDVALRVAEIVTNITLRPLPPLVTPPTVTLVVDVTGVGRPVCDILRNELRRAGHSGVKLTEATFTYGRKLTGRTGQRELTVGKEYLVSRMQALFQTGRLRLPKGHREAEAMRVELQNYEIKVDPDGDARFGAFRTGSHDDLVTALGLSVLCEPQYARVGGIDR